MKNKLSIFNFTVFFLFLIFSLTTALIVLLALKYSFWVFVAAIIPLVLALIFLNIIFSIVKPEKILFWVYPIMEITSKVFKFNFDRFRREFIEYSNTRTLGNLKSIKVDQNSNVLILLPHCLQNSECIYKVTWDKLDNCKACGKCCMPEFIKIREEYKLKMAVVTGGTSAREIIKLKKPKLIIAVACENDLISGLRDVASIPVLAVLNDRPHGPCRDTTVNIDLIRHYLDSIIV